MSLQKYLLRRLHLTKLPKQTYHFEGQVAGLLEALAQRERRPVDEIATEMLAFALEKCSATEINLRYWEDLSQREQQITALVCLNYSNYQIASRLLISPETVKTHIRNVLYKFNLSAKSELRLALSDWDFSAWDEPGFSG